MFIYKEKKYNLHITTIYISHLFHYLQKTFEILKCNRFCFWIFSTLINTFLKVHFLGFFFMIFWFVHYKVIFFFVNKKSFNCKFPHWGFSWHFSPFFICWYPKANLKYSWLIAKKISAEFRIFFAVFYLLAKR